MLTPGTFKGCFPACTALASIFSISRGIMSFMTGVCIFAIVVKPFEILSTQHYMVILQELDLARVATELCPQQERDILVLPSRPQQAQQ